MSVAYLSLGSNLGDRLRLIQEAVAALTVEAGPLTALSSFYETEPWGFSSPHRFLNVALALDTILSPRELLDVSRRIEQKLGRTRKSTDGGYADRTIDIDLLMSLLIRPNFHFLTLACICGGLFLNLFVRLRQNFITRY